MLVRELDERLGLTALIAEHLTDSRYGLNTQFGRPDLVRQSMYSRLTGYEDLNNASRLAVDPAFRLIGSPKMWDRGAALTSTLRWFEGELLTREENLLGLMAVNREVVAQADDGADRVVLDMDSSEPCMRSRSAARTSGLFATTRCFCSRIRSTVSPRSSAPATSPVLTTGTSCFCPAVGRGEQRRESVGQDQCRSNRRTSVSPTGSSQYQGSRPSVCGPCEEESGTGRRPQERHLPRFSRQSRKCRLTVCARKGDDSHVKEGRIVLEALRLEMRMMVEELVVLVHHGVSAVTLLLVDLLIRVVAGRTVLASDLPNVDRFCFWFMVVVLALFSFVSLTVLAITGWRAIDAALRRRRPHEAATSTIGGVA